MEHAGIASGPTTLPTAPYEMVALKSLALNSLHLCALCEIPNQSDDVLLCLLLVQEDDTDYMKD